MKTPARQVHHLPAAFIGLSFTLYRPYTLNIVSEIKDQEPVGTLTVTLTPEDYAGQFEASLRNYRKQIQLPGFRPGTVPMGLVRKRFGRSLLFDQLSRSASEELMKYIQENALKVLGRPYLMRSNFSEDDTQDLEVQEYFFEFQMGIQPQVALSIHDLPELVRYTVTVTDADVEHYITDLRYKSGAVTPAEEVKDVANHHYIIHTCLEELDTDGKVKPGGFHSHLYIHTRMKPRILPQLEGKKQHDKLQVTLTDIFDDENMARNVLDLDKETYESLKSVPLRFALEDIEEQQAAEETPEWWNKMLRIEKEEEQVSTREAFVEKVKTALQANYDRYAERKYEADFIRGLLDAHPFQLPVSFLRQFLLEEAKTDEERKQIDSNLSNYLVEFRMRFIYDALLEAHPELKVDQAAVAEGIKTKFRAYLPPSEEGDESARQEQEQRLEQLAEQFLQNEEMRERESREQQDIAIRDFLLNNKVKKSEKTVSAQEFDKLS
ncbi:MAG: hypothetical protein KF690_02930 [Bacteroidetes bacterium]|nr:hypothetical protein [Bacteroidota bacterium]